MGSAVDTAADMIGDDEARAIADECQKSGFKGAALDIMIMQCAIARHAPSFAGGPPLPAEGTKSEAKVVPVNITPIVPTVSQPAQRAPSAAPPI